MRSVNSMRKPSSGPSTSAIARRTSASPRPGGTRQSTFSSARLGITLIFSEALILVGVNVTPSIGSNIVARRGSAARRPRDRAGGIVGVLADRAQERARLGASASYAGWRSARRASSGAIFNSALSPILGIDACPATPSVVTREAEDALLARSRRRSGAGRRDSITAPAPSLIKQIAAHLLAVARA